MSWTAPRLDDPDSALARFGRNAEPFILLLLADGRSYGYEIRTRLADLGFRRATRDPGMVYRLLRKLEDAGLITSEWQTEGSGPARRYYALRPDGRGQLVACADQLGKQAARIQRFFELYAPIETAQAVEA